MDRLVDLVFAGVLGAGIAILANDLLSEREPPATVADPALARQAIPDEVPPAWAAEQGEALRSLERKIARLEARRDDPPARPSIDETVTQEMAALASRIDTVEAAGTADNSVSDLRHEIRALADQVSRQEMLLRQARAGGGGDASQSSTASELLPGTILLTSDPAGCPDGWSETGRTSLMVSPEYTPVPRQQVRQPMVMRSSQAGWLDIEFHLCGR